ncbi:MAG TPA: tyrosine-type recombinase/integrase [Longimicrobium sp.]
MPKKKQPKLWSYEAGSRGSRVWVGERVPGGVLTCRWWDPVRGQNHFQSLGHRDKAKAMEHADALSRLHRTNKEAGARGLLTLAALFGLYEGAGEPARKKRRGAQDDARRMDIWQAYLGDAFVVQDLTPGILKRFVADRKAGRVAVQGHALGAASDTTAGKDVGFLQAVLRWAGPEGHLDDAPVRPSVMQFALPRNVNPRRPVATYDRFLALRPHCSRHGSGRFGEFVDLVEALGWRAGAICALDYADLDLQALPQAPLGRVLKRAETDKRGVEMWIPLPADARSAIDRLLRKRGAVGRGPLFPRPKDPTRCWTVEYAIKQLRHAERDAGLQPQARGAFHPYRRAWVRARKDWPRSDVAAAGGWQSVRTLEIYDGADEHTLLAVVNEPRKLRDAGAA